MDKDKYFRSTFYVFYDADSTVNNYMREGMPFYKIGAGKLVRFVPEEVEKWIKERG